MKFKVSKGTKIYDELIALNSKMNKAYAEAKKVVKGFGATKFCRRQHVAAGGISAIEFDEKPDGWRMVGDKWQKLYYPKVSNKDACKKIYELPTVSFDEVNKVVNFDAPQTVSSGRGIAWIPCVGLTFGKDYVLIETAEGTKYNPPKDVVEILESEFEKLSKKAK